MIVIHSGLFLWNEYGYSCYKKYTTDHLVKTLEIIKFKSYIQLTHLPLVPYIFVRELGRHGFG